MPHPDKRVLMRVVIAEKNGARWYYGPIGPAPRFVLSMTQPEESGFSLRPVRPARLTFVEFDQSVPNWPGSLDDMAELLSKMHTQRITKYVKLLRDVVGRRLQRDVTDVDLIRSKPQDLAEAWLRLFEFWPPK